MLLVMIAVFGVIIGVNALHGTVVATFPGLVVKNSYVASQNFERRAPRRQALGWIVASRDRRSGRFPSSFPDRDGRAGGAADELELLGRPTNEADDQSSGFARAAGAATGPRSASLRAPGMPAAIAPRRDGDRDRASCIASFGPLP